MTTVNNSYFANMLAPLKNFWETAKMWFSAHEIGLLYFVIGVMVSVAAAILLSWLIRSIIKKLVVKTATDVDDKMVDALHKPLFILLLTSGIMMSLQTLKLGTKSFTVISNVYSLIVALCITIALIRVMNVLRDFFMALAKKSENVYDDLLVGLIFPGIKTVVWVIAILFISENIFSVFQKKDSGFLRSQIVFQFRDSVILPLVSARIRPSRLYTRVTRSEIRHRISYGIVSRSFAMVSMDT